MDCPSTRRAFRKLGISAQGKSKKEKGKSKGVACCFALQLVPIPIIAEPTNA